MENLFQCPECGQKISTRAHKCIHCGYPIPQQICSVCGIHYAKDLSACPECEFADKINDVITTETGIEETKPLVLITKTKNGNIILLIFVFVSLLFYIVYNTYITNFTSTVDESMSMVPSFVDSAEVKIIEDEIEQEDFNSFFRHFQRDSVFQKSRIIFPLTNVYLDAPDYKIQIITHNEWVYNSLDWDPTYVERDEDAYNQEILIESDTAKIKYLGTNNGINCEYIYICKNGEWFLYKIIDRSM